MSVVQTKYQRTIQEAIVGKTQKVKEKTATYTAAIRYNDGNSELIRVKAASSLTDAREIINDQILDLRSFVISVHGCPIQ